MIGIIDYNAGNVQSVCNALSQQNIDFRVAHSPHDLEEAHKIIFPGVGHAKSCMSELQARGFDIFLQTTSLPVLGICVGMQMLFDWSEEGTTKCLGIIPGKVQKFDSEKTKIIPHMGWNTVYFTHFPFTIDTDTTRGDDFYFVHSYYCIPEDSGCTIATTTYESQSFCSAVQYKNFYGVQFHPEKSGENGLRMLHSFCTQ